MNGPTDAAALGTRLLTRKNIDEIIDRIYTGTDTEESDALSFTEKVEFFSRQYANDIKINSPLGWQWVRYEEGSHRIINPYELLPAVFEGVDNQVLDSSVLDEDSSIAEGGAAMTAYARMQFTEMSSEERDKIISALLKYCELDTFAMVLVWKGLAYWIAGGQ